jgi:hypothetical protein
MTAGLVGSAALLMKARIDIAAYMILVDMVVVRFVMAQSDRFGRLEITDGQGLIFSIARPLDSAARE